MDCSPPGSFGYGILQEGIPEWVAIFSYRESSQPRNRPRSPALQVDSSQSETSGNPSYSTHSAAARSLSRVWPCDTPQTAPHQAPLSLGFSKQEYWSELPFLSPMHTYMLRHLNSVWLCATPWTAAHQAPLPTGFSRQEYWSGLPFPSPHIALSWLKKETLGKLGF